MDSEKIAARGREYVAALERVNLLINKTALEFAELAKQLEHDYNNLAAAAQLREEIEAREDAKAATHYENTYPNF